VAFCNPSDVYDHGLPRGALPGTGRVVSEIAQAGDGSAVFRLRAHGFAADAAVRVRAEAGGRLPSPLEQDVPYYVQPLNEDAFQLALAAEGDPITVSSRACGLVVIPPDVVQAACEWATSLVEEMMPAHVLPLEEPYPEAIRITTAELAAWKAMGNAGGAQVSLTAMYDEAQKRVARWAKGVPLRKNPPPAANKALVATAPARQSGWSRFGGIE
jgi:hypothetical protein